MLDTHLHILVAVTKANGRSLGTSPPPKKKERLSEIEENCIENAFNYRFIRLLFACFSTWRLGFDTGPFRLGFVVDEVTVRQVCLVVLRSFPVSVILSMHCNDRNVNTNTGASGRSLETFKQSNPRSDIEEN